MQLRTVWPENVNGLSFFGRTQAKMQGQSIACSQTGTANDLLHLATTVRRGQKHTRANGIPVDESVWARIKAL